MKRVIIVVLLFFCFLALINFIMNSVEKKECRRWHKSQITAQWQVEQCANHNINIKE